MTQVLETAKLTQLAALYNFAADKIDQPKVTKFSDRAAAIRRVQNILAEASLVAARVGDDIVAVDPANKPREGDERKITITNGNPKRPGTKAHAVFELYKTGMSVGALVKKVGDRRQAMIDLKYNVDHGHITLS